MAKQKIDVEIKTKGAKKAESAIGRVDKSTTRLGQTSASTGKQFSAQATGLGGLVATYAGAAATIFAVQQAFAALSKAAAAEQTIRGVQSLATAIGESGDFIIAKVQEVTKHQLDMVDAAQNVNIALSAGFNAEQIENLSEVSLKASRALGRTLGDAFNRLVRGTAKLEPELLDELGIFTRIEPAVEKYATSIGKSSGQLTSFQRRQAFVNAAIEEGKRKFDTINTSVPTASESIEKFGATIIDLGLEIGMLLANVLAPFADFLSGNLANSLAAFGLLASSIFSKGVSILEQKISGTVDSINNKFDSMINKLASKTAVGKEALKSLNDTTENLNKSFARGPEREKFKNLVKLGQQGKLTAADLTKLKTALEEQKTLTAQEIKFQEEKLARGKLGQKSIANTTKKIAALKLEQEKLAISSKAATAAIAEQGKIASFATKSFRVMGSTIAFVGKTVTKLVGLIGILITVISTITLVGGIIAKFLDIDEKIKELGNSFLIAAKQLTGFTDEAIRASKGLKALSQGLLEIKLQAAGLKDIISFKIQDSLLFGLIDFENIQLIETLPSKIRDVVEEITRLQKAREPVPEEFSYLGYGGISASDYPLEAFDEVAKVTEMFDELLKPTTAIGEKIKKIAIETTLATLKMNKFAEQIQLVAEESGMSSVEVVKSFKLLSSTNIATFKGLQDITKNLGFQVLNNKQLTAEAKKQALETGKIGEALKTEEKIRISMLETIRKGHILGIISTKQIEDLSDELKRGAISADGISKRLIALSTIRARITKELKGINDELLESLLKQLDVTTKIITARGDQQIAIEQLTKTLRKTFNAEIAAADKLTGVMNLQGILAKTQLQTRTNQIVLLGQVLERTKNINELDERREKLLALRKSAEKTLVGLLVKTREELKKINVELEKRLDKTTARIDQEQSKIKIAVIKNEIALLEFLFKLEKQRTGGEKTLLDLNIKKNIALTKAQNIINNTKLEKQTLELEKQLKLAQGIFAPFFTDKEISNIEIAIAEKSFERLEREAQQKLDRIELENIQKRINLQADKQLLNVEEEKRRNILDQNKELLKIEKEQQNKKNIATIKQLELEAKLIEERFNLIDLQAKILREHVADLGDLLLNHIVSMKESLSEVPFSKEARAALVEKLRPDFETTTSIDLDTEIAKGRNSLSNYKDSITLLSATLEQATQDQFKFGNRKLKRDDIFAEKELNTKQKVLDASIALLEVELDLAEKESKAKIEIELQKLKDLREIAKKENDTINRFMNNLAKGVKQAFGDGIKSIVIDVFNGTKSIKEAFRDMLINILQAIQKAAAEKLIAEPLVGVAGGFLKGGGEFLKGLFLTSGGLIPSMANGGTIPRMASGGLRDSVPAMLEPGEFVVKKRAVSEVGLPALQKINSGGSKSLTPVIQIINQGTPQTQAKEPKITFDPEQMVIKIVTKDLENNGPIRQSIRGIRG